MPPGAGWTVRLKPEHGGTVRVHADREDLLNHLVLQVGRDTVVVLHERQRGELVVQQEGFLAGAVARAATAANGAILTSSPGPWKG